jgi:mono/diheme cytochrome c family protein
MASNAKTNNIFIALCVLMAALVPFALVARSRSIRNGKPAPHLILDMDKQAKFKAQREDPMFADDREERGLIPHTVALEDLQLKNENTTDPTGERVLNNAKQIDDPTTTMVISDEETWDRVMLGQTKQTPTGVAEFLTAVPAPFHANADFLHRGQERFNIYCAPCHGQTGNSDGMVAAKAAEYQDAGNADAAGAWVKPTDYHTASSKALPIGSIYNTITNGIRNMPRYDKQISVADRWAIAAYVKALQLSQGADPKSLPAEVQTKLGTQ